MFDKSCRISECTQHWDVCDLLLKTYQILKAADFAQTEIRISGKDKILQNGMFPMNAPLYHFFSFILMKMRFQLKNAITSLGLATKSKVTNYRSNSSEFASFSEFRKWKRESPWRLESLLLVGAESSSGPQNLPSCRFRNLGAKQTHILCLPSLLFSEVLPIKHPLDGGFNATRQYLEGPPFLDRGNCAIFVSRNVHTSDFSTISDAIPGGLK